MRTLVACALLIAGLASLSDGAAVPLLELRGEAPEQHLDLDTPPRVRVAEGAPALLCAGLCNNRGPAPAPLRGPVCAFNAVGTARTFATLCDLENASCRDSTYYAIASIGEC